MGEDRGGVAMKKGVKGFPKLAGVRGIIGNKLGEVATAGGGNEFRDEFGLGLKVDAISWGFGFTVKGFQAGAFGFG